MKITNGTFHYRALSYSAILLGWVLCGYLMYRSTLLKTDPSAIPDLCNMIFGVSCDKALSSKLSWQLGFHLAGWGLAYFGLLALLFSFQKSIIDRAVILLAALGVGVSAVQTWVIIVGKVPCPFCLSIHVINLLALAALFAGLRSSIATGESNQAILKRPLFQWALVLLAAVGIGAIAEYSVFRATFMQPPVDLEEVAAAFEKEPVYDIPKNEASPHVGSLDAPVQLTVFSSFQCPACKSFAAVIESLHEKYGDDVGITFRNFPLSTKCNPAIVDDMQPQACDAAFAAFAAQDQGRFWEYHDQLYQSDLIFDEKSLVSIAENTGLDVDQWEAARESEAVQTKLAEDLAVAYQLKINATPTVYLNGRRVNNFQESVLNLLIESELNKHSN